MQNTNIDLIALVSSVSSAFAALAALITVWYLRSERQSDMKKDFVLWAIERLRDPGMRDARRAIYLFTDDEWQELEKAVRERAKDPRLDAVRLVCLSFDEIGYFIYKVGLVNYRDILDMYPQAVKIWNKVYNLIKVWRELEDANTFLYFEMLARQQRLEVKPTFESPKKLYPA